MNRKLTALRVLCERRVAERFEEVTSGMKVAQFTLHMQSVLAAALVNPRFVVTDILKGKSMSLQVNAIRTSRSPVLLKLPCNGREEKATLRRLLLALTSEVAALIDTHDLPDSSTVLRALISEWLGITALDRRFGPGSSGLSQNVTGLSGRGKIQSSRRRRRKSSKGPAKLNRAVPHPIYTDVSAVPIDWSPGRRGRPPLGSTRSDDGTWNLPEGFREIDGRIHPPIPIFHDAESVREILRQVGQQDRKKRNRKEAHAKEGPDGVFSPANSPVPAPTATTGGQQPASFSDQPAQEKAGDAPPGEPPSTQEDGGHPDGTSGDR